MTELTDWTKRGMAGRPVEADIVSRIWDALDAADHRVVRADGERVLTKEDMLNVVFNLDECYLNTESGSFVYLIMGQDWDTLADYGVSLDEALAPVLEYVRR